MVENLDPLRKRSGVRSSTFRYRIEKDEYSLLV